MTVVPERGGACGGHEKFLLVILPRGPGFVFPYLYPALRSSGPVWVWLTGS
jgi:hypothetical protein